MYPSGPITTFSGGPCDGLKSREDYGGKSMVFIRSRLAFHLYERVSDSEFEHWGIFPDSDVAESN